MYKNRAVIMVILFKENDLPDKKYGLILADPPWYYRNKNTGGSMKSGAAQQYATMKTDAIMRLPIQRIAADDAVLFLWATSPMKEDALLVMYYWGFQYKFTMYWEKVEFGMGYWVRDCVEELLVGIRGNVPAFRMQRRNIYRSRPLGHSRKPSYYYDFFEKTGIKPRIELFARERREGWDCWGLEVPRTMQKLLRLESWM